MAVPTCQCAPALVALKNEMNAAYPLRDHASDGCCGDAAHASRVSDHNPTFIRGYWYAHALDIDEDLFIGQEGYMSNDPAYHPLTFLWDWFRAHPDPRIKYMIYEGQIVWPNSTYDTNPRPYSGPNAHDHHLHISIWPDATFNTSTWLTFLSDHPELTDMSEPVIAHPVQPGTDGRYACYTLQEDLQQLWGRNGADFGPSTAYTVASAYGLNIIDLKSLSNKAVTNIGATHLPDGTPAILCLAHEDSGTFVFPMK